MGGIVAAADWHCRDNEGALKKGTNHDREPEIVPLARDRRAGAACDGRPEHRGRSDGGRQGRRKTRRSANPTGQRPRGRRTRRLGRDLGTRVGPVASTPPSSGRSSPAPPTARPCRRPRPRPRSSRSPTSSAGIEVRQTWAGDAGVEVQRRLRVYDGEPTVTISDEITNRGGGDVHLDTTRMLDVSEEGKGSWRLGPPA